jgi:tRNA nucleotidyltransferase/poly(A) polymerase
MGRSKNNSPIDEDVFFILNLIEKHGYEARIVGGSVRDFIAGKTISDIDMATTAHPMEIIDICARTGLMVLPTSPRHGSVTIRHNNKSYEVTTLRQDVKTFGRDAEVEFSKSFEMDSNRRDFSINAIYMDKKGKIYDYHSGIEDIRSGKIRFIGDAQKRISEDYLRILRYFRFVAVYGNYKCNPEYLDIITKLKGHIKILSSERIIAELLKIFKIPDSYRIIPAMWEILGELFSLKCNSIEVCRELDILESLSDIEKLSMLLKFSNSNDLAYSYNFSRYIRELILLEYIDHSQIFTKLKQIKKEHRIFYAKFWVVNSRINGKYSATDARTWLEDLLKFCQSEYIDFKFSPSELGEHNLTKNELKSIMIATKKFWLDQIVSHDQCREFAMRIYKTCKTY